MKTYKVKYFLMGLIKTEYGITAIDYKSARTEFERVKGDYTIFLVLLDNK